MADYRVYFSNGEKREFEVDEAEEPQDDVFRDSQGARDFLRKVAIVQKGPWKTVWWQPLHVTEIQRKE